MPLETFFEVSTRLRFFVPIWALPNHYIPTFMEIF